MTLWYTNTEKKTKDKINLTAHTRRLNILYTEYTGYSPKFEILKAITSKTTPSTSMKFNSFSVGDYKFILELIS